MNNKILSSFSFEHEVPLIVKIAFQEGSFIASGDGMRPVTFRWYVDGTLVQEGSYILSEIVYPGSTVSCVAVSENLMAISNEIQS